MSILVVLTKNVKTSDPEDRMTRTPGNRPWTEADLPDQRGRVALVTGANSGTGFEAAKVLARKGAHVILACRQVERAMGAEHRIRTEVPGASLERLALDLGSLDSVRAAAAAFGERHGRLDLLLNNAGVMIPPRGRTADGFELQFGTNHLGHFALTGLLMPRLLAAPGSRVVTMSSLAHRTGRMAFEDLQSERRYRAWAAYGQSKLANLLFTFELQRRLRGAGASTLALAAHPGWARTELQRHALGHGAMRALNGFLAPLLSHDAAGGALPLLRAATDHAAIGGDYFGPSGFQGLKGSPVPTSVARQARDAEAGLRLWNLSERLTGVAFPL
jgi:NAD(P)-dependent dehydrogenase (short-subunit alcohol dehydrogenase family)